MSLFTNTLAGGILALTVLAIFAEGMARSTVVDMSTTMIVVLAVILSVASIARAS